MQRSQRGLARDTDLVTRLGCSLVALGLAVATGSCASQQHAPKAALSTPANARFFHQLPAGTMSAVEAEMKKGIVFVSVHGDDVKVLPSCTDGHYDRYEGLAPEDGSTVLDHTSDLDFRITAKAEWLGTASLGEVVAKSQSAVQVRWVVVGERSMNRDVLKWAKKGADCEGATHIVTSVHVGAYDFLVKLKEESMAVVLGGHRVVLTDGTSLGQGGRFEDAPATKMDEPVLGCDKPVAIYLEPLPGPPVAGYVVTGLGLVGVGVGAYFGYRATSLKDESQKTCDGAICDDSAGAEAWNDARTASKLSTIGFAAGAVGLGIGTFLLWPSNSGSSQSAEMPSAVRVGVAPVGDGISFGASARW